ncbi:MAG: 50S ribosomal protein L4 [Clostridia bacterium]|nr:50S ribosomal protein L4 [Clostridia bacterium]
MQLNVLDMTGTEVGKINLDDAVFARDYNEALIHQVVVSQLANQRQGTHAALTRAEVRGGGAKPFRQKGTGRARQGSSRSPQQVGGGIAFAKKPRDFSQKINKSMKKAAFLSAVSQKIRQNELTVLDKFEISECKTKLVAAVVDALKLSGKIIFVIDEPNETLLRAVGNMPGVELQEVRTLSVYDVVATRNIIFTKSAVAKLEEANK